MILYAKQFEICFAIPYNTALYASNLTNRQLYAMIKNLISSPSGLFSFSTGSINTAVGVDALLNNKLARKTRPLETAHAIRQLSALRPRLVCRHGIGPALCWLLLTRMFPCFFEREREVRFQKIRPHRVESSLPLR